MPRARRQPKSSGTPAAWQTSSLITNGTPWNGPAGMPAATSLALVVGEDLEHGVERGVDAGDAVERRLPQLGGGRFLLTDQLGEAERVVLRVFVESHRTSF